ncbi:MAG: endonuclease/exonuclease/phosphatase family protein [Rhodospirillales bacterium]|nr:endonuclease/exonuclease/phosphatase family protein [Rhodospirillales bacterium]
MKFASYNIQYGTGKDGIVDLARIAADIGDADVIALQEVEQFNSTTAMTDQVAELSALFPRHYVTYGPGVDLDASHTDTDGRVINRRRQFGNMLLSKTPIISSRNHLLPKYGLAGPLALQRSALEGVIDGDLGLMRVYSVHLGHAAAPERALQIRSLLKTVRNAPRHGGAWSGKQAGRHWTTDGPQPPMPAPALLMGDFNLEPDSSEYEQLVGPSDRHYGRLTRLDGLVDIWTRLGQPLDGAAGKTCPDEKGDKRIDYAFATVALAERATAMRVDQQAQGSDHQPLFIDFD